MACEVASSVSRNDGSAVSGQCCRSWQNGARAQQMYVMDGTREYMMEHDLIPGSTLAFYRAPDASLVGPCDPQCIYQLVRPHVLLVLAPPPD